MSLQWRREGNLPEESTSFVGREGVLRLVGQALRSHRLVTVTGCGGVGKTRVALRVARQAAELYPDGVWLAELGHLRDPSLVPRQVGLALGLADVSARSDLQVLTDFLADGKRLLLVLDTCEHLLGAVAHLARTLLESAPGIRILATSRSPLDAAGEHLIEISPLTTTPGPAGALAGRPSEAVALFVERARAIVPQFVLGSHNVHEVEELCRRLDGIPLALELAAVRLRGLSVAQILTLLEQSMAVLEAADRTAPERHRTLRATLGWSHELCQPAERLLWARLSVFAGDFDLYAAMRVCQDDGVLESDEIPYLLESLVHKSILIRGPEGTRYRMLDTVREYGALWLSRLRDTGRMRRRHLAHYLQLARRGELEWMGTGQVLWFERMRQETSNIRAAIDYSLSEPGQRTVGLDLVSSLWFMWVACGFPSEGRHYLLRMLSACPDPSPARCRALWAEAYVANGQGDLTAAVNAAERCLAEARELGDRDAKIMAIKMLGTSAMLTGDFGAAARHLGRAITYLQDLDEPRRVELLAAVVEIGMVTTMRGEPQEALSTLEECLRMCQERGELWLRSYALYVLALAYHRLGRVEEAVEAARSALRIKRHFSDVLGIVMTLDALSQMVVEVGWPAEMVGELQAAAEVNWREYGLPLMGSPMLTDGHVQAADQAIALIGPAAHEAARARGSRMGLLEAIAYATGDAGEPGRAGPAVRVIRPGAA
ncbi:tetratricopeptide repeat protein [Nonomuraea sp. NPDC050310]|uniref:ATP-binding protein n=1 Tax=unclassified Nonomuraea TaxID=2593643 RepID=UPI0033DAEC46